MIFPLFFSVLFSITFLTFMFPHSFLNERDATLHGNHNLGYHFLESQHALNIDGLISIDGRS